jgi:hypothetical protein
VVWRGLVAFCNRHWRAAHWLVGGFWCSCAEAPRMDYMITIYYLLSTPPKKLQNTSNQPTPISPISEISPTLYLTTTTPLPYLGGYITIIYFWGMLADQSFYRYYRHVMREKYVTSLHLHELLIPLPPWRLARRRRHTIHDVYTYTSTTCLTRLPSLPLSHIMYVSSAWTGRLTRC